MKQNRMQQFEQKLVKAAGAYRAVAFDVFDTLLLRDVAIPKDLFAWMEETGQTAPGFAKARSEAERAARAAKQGEVTLEEIYAQPALVALHAAPQAECTAELSCCTPNIPLCRAAGACHARGQRVYAVSDMYLPQAQIAAMLQKCGLDFLDGVFVSGEYGAQKRSGKLFSLFLQKTGLHAAEVLFVGDDLRADFCGAALAHMRCLRAPALPPLPYTPVAQTVAQGCRYAFINNRATGKSSLEALGLETLGPLVTSFADWVDACRRQDPARALVFLARDMFLVRRAYHLRHPGQAPSGYLKVSRKSLIPALLLRPMNEENIGLLADALPRQTLTAEEIFAYCGFAPGTARKLAPGEDVYDLKARPLHGAERELLLCAAAGIKRPEGESLRAQAELVLGYLAVNLPPKAFLVDIGSGGTTQRLLQALCGSSHDLRGLYLACDARLRQHFTEEQAQVCLFDGNPAPLWYWTGQPMLERLISEPCGATIGYRLDTQTGDICPLAGEAVEAAQIALCQQGCMAFAEGWGKEAICAPEQGFLSLVRAPRLRDATALGALTVEDGAEYSLAAPQRLGHYLLHPRDIAGDLAAARWKTAFLKRLCRLPLPYDKLYAKLKQTQGG